MVTWLAALQHTSSPCRDIHGCSWIRKEIDSTLSSHQVPFGLLWLARLKCHEPWGLVSLKKKDPVLFLVNESNSERHELSCPSWMQDLCPCSRPPEISRPDATMIMVNKQTQLNWTLHSITSSKDTRRRNSWNVIGIGVVFSSEQACLFASVCY